MPTSLSCRWNQIGCRLAARLIRGSLPLRGLSTAIVVVSALLIAHPAAAADNRDLEFLRGLRQKQYFDYALLYLDRLEARKDLDPAVQAVLAYERAVTHLENSRTLRNIESRSKELDLAQASLEKFVKENPSHPLAAQANSERAQILLNRGRVLIWESRSSQNAARKPELQKEARETIAGARKLFQEVHDLQKAEWDKLPRIPINPDNEKTKEAKDQARELLDKRNKVEAGYMRAQLDVAICTYEESQTYNTGSPEARKILQKAAGEFEQIHTKYRSQLIGLHSRMWQGKCFEEQGDREIDRAIGIYNEILQHPGRSESLTQLQHRVRQFRLICLNHDSNKDYELAVQEATAWLAQNKELSITPVGLGIRWERARAEEQLGLVKDRPENERTAKLKDALDDARTINQFAGEFKDASGGMISRVNVALNRDPGDPKDFDGAFGLARNHVNEIAKYEDQIAAAGDENEKQKVRAELNSHLKECVRLLRLAVDLALPSTDRRNVYNAQFLLGFVHYQLKNSYDAAILGDHVGRKAKILDSALALEAAYLSFASWQQVYESAPAAAKPAELASLEREADFIVKSWGDSDRATEVRMTIGQLLDRNKQPEEAAKWYEQVPDSADQYPQAQLAAGQAYWTAWLNSASLPESERPAPEIRDQWQASAEKLLRAGTAAQQEKAKDSSESPATLIAGKVSLAQILVSKGEYPAAIELLTAEPQAPMSAIGVDDESQRPADGIKGRPFASLVYQLLLRAYVGSQKIDEALETMKGLESVAGGAGGEGIATVYVSLGREIQTEIERLVSVKDEARLTQVRDSFDKFLNTLFERRTSMSYGSLIWMAETYFGLGQGMRENTQVAHAYFSKAASLYEEILKRDEADDKFIPDDREAGVRLRLVNCLKREGQFERAVEIVRAVLKELPWALDAQVEAASVLEEWGTVDPEKYLVAIDGFPPRGETKTAENSNTGVIWGWAALSSRLQRILADGKQTQNDADYRDKFADARYHIAMCRRKLGLKKTGQERTDALTAAVQEVDAFSLVAGDVSDESWKKFDDLYQQLQKDLGQKAKPLKKPVAHTPEAVAKADTTSPAEDTTKKAAGDKPDAEPNNPAQKAAAAPATPAEKPSETGMGTYLGFIAILIAATLGAFYYVNIHSKSKRKRVQIGGRLSADDSNPVVSQTGTPRTRPRPKSRGVDQS